MSEARTAVVLLSGGLDSGVAAARFVADGGRVLASLCFDYGQRAAARERAAATALAQRFGGAFHAVPLPWLASVAARGGSALVAGGGALPTGTVERPGDAASAVKVWVPARNAVFVAIGAAYAEAFGAQCVVAGFNREEAVTFPDNSAAFLAAASAFLAHGTRTGVRVVSPTIGMDKAAIVAAARALGFTADDFWSCYEGGERPCGRCESCLRSRWQR
ncbi:MAG: 7-cyano-7-deazaguanine synthase QueC [Planctomycetes bacterium]|nr:7-cyano-7-deazaguanine synthase QueC [Planctomycetota bacterium]